MVDAERAGVMSTADPSTRDTARIVVEGAFGLGEVVVGGQVEPDTYVLSKEGPRLLEARIGVKSHKLERDPGGTTRRVELDAEARSRRVLSDAEVAEVAAMGLRIEQHYGAPQDIEWAYQDGTLYCLQARPITTLEALSPERGAVLVKGLGASMGRASGRARVLASPAEGDALLAGEILVAPMTTPDWVPVLRRAAGLTTDGGGMTCHAAIVSRELRIPCVVGTRTATKVLRDGELVTLDGQKGQVWAGDIDAARAQRRWGHSSPASPAQHARGCTLRLARAGPPTPLPLPMRCALFVSLRSLRWRVSSARPCVASTATIPA